MISRDPSHDRASKSTGGDSEFLLGPTRVFEPLEVVGDGSGPREIGPYRILGKIGEGGMGIVYKAMQERPNRTVALKIVRAPSPELLRRFELEAEYLGRLQHPGIAQVYEAGTARTDHGDCPYFAMEWIDGQNLAEHVKQHEPDRRERLEILIKLCRAVQHAHQRGLIHRDLKPANVMIDTRGEPRILDFGIARPMEAERVTSLQTGRGQLVGTLPYMSPEQVSGDPELVDARSDVYALGVIGYELLIGRLPYDLAERTIPEAVRIIGEETAAPLSSTSRFYRGDLDTIFAKALAKERERRYQTASEFAEDIERYLDDRPIVARPPSALYQLTKFAKRNKALVTAACALFIAAGTGVGAWIWTLDSDKQRLEAERKTQNANIERLNAEAQARSAELLRSAENALDRGQWEVGLRELTTAVESGVELPRDLRLRRVEALYALNRMDDAREALAEVEALTDLEGEGPGEAQSGLAQLWAVDLDPQAWLHYDSTAARVRAAIEAGLPPAQLAYAEALVAPDFPTAVDHLEDSVKENPFQVGARIQLILHLQLLGEHDRAEEHIERHQSLFGQDPNVALCFALSFALRGEPDSALEQIEFVNGRMGGEDVAALRETVKVLGELVAQFDLAKPLDSARVVGLVLMVQRLHSVASPLTGDLPVPPLFRKVLPSVLPVLGALATNQHGTVESQLERVTAVFPEGTCLCLLGTAQYFQGKFAEAAESLEKASHAPSLSRSEVSALQMAILNGMNAIVVDPSREEAYGPAVREHLERLARLDAMSLDRAYFMVTIAVARGEVDLARQFVGQWEERSEDPKVPRYYRAVVEFHSEAYSKCIALCQEILVDEPERRDVLDLLEKARQALAEEASRQ